MTAITMTMKTKSTTKTKMFMMNTSLVPMKIMLTMNLIIDRVLRWLSLSRKGFYRPIRAKSKIDVNFHPFWIQSLGPSTWDLTQQYYSYSKKSRKKVLGRRLLCAGYNFWSSSEYGGGSHVTHALSLLIHQNFSSKLMITWFNLFKIPLLVHFQTARYFAFDSVQIIQGRSKAKFDE